MSSSTLPASTAGAAQAPMDAVVHDLNYLPNVDAPTRQSIAALHHRTTYVPKLQETLDTAFRMIELTPCLHVVDTTLADPEAGVSLLISAASSHIRLFGQASGNYLTIRTRLFDKIDSIVKHRVWPTFCQSTQDGIGRSPQEAEDFSAGLFLSHVQAKVQDLRDIQERLHTIHRKGMLSITLWLENNGYDVEAENSKVDMVVVENEFRRACHKASMRAQKTSANTHSKKQTRDADLEVRGARQRDAQKKRAERKAQSNQVAQSKKNKPSNRNKGGRGNTKKKEPVNKA